MGVDMMEFNMNPTEIENVEASLKNVLKYMKDSAEKISDKLRAKKKEYLFLKDFDIKVFHGDSLHFGDLTHHVAVDVKCQKKTKYFISMVTLNFDQNTLNVHEVWGRIQIIVGGNGNPNRSIRVKMEGIETVNATVIAYPLMIEDKTKDSTANTHKLVYRGSKKSGTELDTLVDEFIKGRRIFQTGYKLFGSTNCDDIILTDDNIDEFVNLIIEFISKCEKVHSQNEICHTSILVLEQK